MFRPDVVAQIASTLALCGLIWTVQLVHYPLLARVGADSFRAYHAAHTRLITLVVGPLMAVELGGAVMWVAAPTDGTPAWVTWGGLGLAISCWLSTAFVQVPQHRRLESGFDAATHAALVRTNWIRTAAWTARGALFVWLLSRGGA